MVFGILYRMILWELTKVFLMSLVGITGILLMAGIIAEAAQQGLGPAQILAAIPLLVPSTLPYTLPATTLFAACVVYGRLSGDNEILAIRAAGINLVKVVGPGLVLGLIMSGVTMTLYYSVIPYTHHLLRAMVLNDIEELLYSLLNKHGFINHTQMPYSMWVKKVQGRKLLNPTFKRRDVNGEADIVAQAKEAELRVDRTNKLLLIKMRFGVVTSADGSRAFFEDRTWEVPLPNTFDVENQRRARDLTWNEILEKREALKQETAQFEVDLAESAARERQPGAAPELALHVSNLRSRIDFNQKNIRFLDIELIMRPALSLGCFCFILVGCPIGIWFSRSDYLSSFITCFLPCVLTYYPLMLCGTGMAKDGAPQPELLVWGADIIVGVVGLGLFWKLLRN